MKKLKFLTFFHFLRNFCWKSSIRVSKLCYNVNNGLESTLIFFKEIPASELFFMNFWKSKNSIFFIFLKNRCGQDIAPRGKWFISSFRTSLVEYIAYLKTLCCNDRFWENRVWKIKKLQFFSGFSAISNPPMRIFRWNKF